MEMLDHALAYAEKGFSVFPCEENGKAPLTHHGFEDATTDPEKIADWWDKHPKANIGIPSGGISGFIAVDVDPRNGGDASAKKLPDLPKTPTQKTGGGGYHYLLKHFPVKRFKLRTGIDIKSDGGYIIAAPSKTDDYYQWLEGRGIGQIKFAEAPDWLKDDLTKYKEKTPVPLAVGEKITEGRNNYLQRLLGVMHNAGISDEAIMKALIVENDTRCDPPMPLDRLERTVFKSLKRYPKGHEILAEYVTIDIGSLPWRTATELINSPQAKIDWLVEGVVAKYICTEVTAKVKIGKTTFMFFLIRALLEGTPFLGVPTKKSKVLLYTEERDVTLKAVLDRVGITESEDFLILKDVEVAGDLSWEQKCQAIEKHALEFGADVLFVDTLSKLAKIKDENSTAEGAQAMRPLEKIAQCGLAVYTNRHGRKSGGDVEDAGRGASSISGSSDLLFQLTRKSDATGNRRVLTSSGRLPSLLDNITIEWDETNKTFINLGGSPDVEFQRSVSLIKDYLPSTPTSQDDFLKILEKNKESVARSTLQRALKSLMDSNEISGLAKSAGKQNRAFGYYLPIIGNEDEQLVPHTQMNELPSPHPLGGRITDQAELTEVSPWTNF